MPRARSRPPLPPGFGVIWASVAVDLVGFGIVLPILPIYARRLHTSTFDAALLVAAFSAATFVCSPLWGRVSDRVGRKPVLLVSLVGTAAGSLLTGLATGLPLLLAGRLLDGASGASVSVAQAAAADLAAPAERPRLFGLLGAAFGIGFVAGPAIGALSALGGPRVPFLLAAGIAAVNAMVGLARLPETRAPGAVAGSGPGRGGAAAGRPARWAGPGVAPLLVVAFCAVVAFSGFEATFALFGQRHLGFGVGSAAAVFTGVGAVIVIVQGGVVHRVTARLGTLETLALGLALDVAGFALLAPARSWALAAPALLALTVGQGLVQTTMATAVADRAAAARRGAALGAQQAAGGLARVVGPVAGGALLGAGASGAPYLLGAVVAAAALAALLAAGGRRAPSPVSHDVTLG